MYRGTDFTGPAQEEREGPHRESELACRAELASDRRGGRQRRRDRIKSNNPNTVGEEQSVFQTMRKVIMISSVQESSNSELSSGGKRPFKVFGFSHFFSPLVVLCRHLELS